MTGSVQSQHDRDEDRGGEINDNDQERRVDSLNHGTPGDRVTLENRDTPGDLDTLLDRVEHVSDQDADLRHDEGGFQDEADLLWD